MQPGSSSAHPSSLLEAEEVDVPGRPDFDDVYQQRDRPIPASAVLTVTLQQEQRTTRPESKMVYMPEPSPEMQYFARCMAYAYITPAGAACKADPPPFIRRAIHAVVPRVRFNLVLAGHGSDRGVRFCSPEDREAAMEKQPFVALDGASVRLVRSGETSNRFSIRLDCVAHVALLRYPKELRNLEDIRSNCSGFGHLMEVDPACNDAPDLSPVRVVVNMQHPREIPREVRIRYTDFRFCSVVPVKILKIWDISESTGADGKYVHMYSTAVAADAAP